MIMLGCVILFSLNTSLAHKQLNWYIIGFIVCCGVPITIKYLPRLNLKIVKYLYLLITLTLFLATLIIGEEDFGAKNWLTVFGLTFQPSEFNKLFFILYLTSSLTEYNLKFLNFKELVKKLSLPTIISIIFILCLVLQNDLGSALIFFVTYLCIVYVSSSRAWILGLSGILFGIACRFAYNNFSHVKIRIDIWADPYNHIYTTGEQILKSLISISSAGFMGIGLNTERLSEIPVVEKDLIFSAICEELGILFGIMLVLLILNTFNICLKISTSTNSRFLSLLSFGIINLLIFQSFLTIGGSINLIPLTGVTLPFISYGGSSTIVSFISIGLIQWIFTRNFNIKNNKIIKY
ncbi:MAG: FtsW/RodA/SpoVE family cell cycle protein [bacterium]